MTEEKKPNNRNFNKKNNRKRRPFDKNKPKGHPKNKNQFKNKKRSRWTPNRISEHFMKRDFDSRNKDCDCTTSLRISLGLVGIIEAIRSKLNKRIEIVTGFYCPDCRDKKYGIRRDFHNNGVAADIRVEGIDIVDLFIHAESYDEIKGLGINFDDNHVHIDTRKEDERECWVEKDGELIQLTDENREEFIPSKLSNDSITTSSD